MSSPKKIVIFDSNAVIHRAFHALPPFTTKDGVMVNAVYGYAKLWLKVLRELKPDVILAAFDVSGGTFRDKEFAEYKANRTALDPNLAPQIGLTRDFVEKLGIPVLSKKGYEADDVIGTVAKYCQQHQIELVIVTGDMDVMQLVGGHVSVYSLRKSLTDTVLFDTDRVIEKYQIRPDQIIDYKGLKGDTSDNIPGVPGIGDLRAVALLHRFSTLEQIYDFVDEYESFDAIPKDERQGLTKSIFSNLKQYRDQAHMSQSLATIMQEVPLEYSISEYCEEYSQDIEQIKIALQELEFYSLIKELPGVLGVSSVDQKLVSEVSVIEVSKQSELRGVLALSFFENGWILSDQENKVYRLSQNELYACLMSEERYICYDIKPLLRQKRLRPTARLDDCMILAYLINPDERAVSLEDRCLLYTIPFDPRYPYQSLHRLHHEILQLAQKHNLYEAVYNLIERPLLAVLAQMEAQGVLFDIDKLEETRSFVDGQLIKVTEDIYTLAGGEFNINSPRQLGEVLFGKLSISSKGIKKTSGGQISTSAEVLEGLRNDYEIVELILEYRELAKLKSTYIDVLPQLRDEQGRIHTDYQQTIAATGRLSSINPNLQNIPARSELGRAIKQCFVAPKGWTLVACDYSQIELRLAAHLSQDTEMLRVFKEDKDFHTATAARMYHVAEEEVTKDMRSSAKAINFGILYGMGSVSLGKNLKVSRKEANEFLERYHKAYPQLMQYIEKQKMFGLKRQYAKTEYGRIRDLHQYDLNNPRTRALLERIAVNMPIQGLQADIIKLAMIQIDAQIQDSDDINMLLQVHDELVFEVIEDKAEYWAEKIVAIMESIYQASIQIKVGVAIKPYWG